MPLSKTNIAVVFLVGFVNYLEWAVVMTSIYPYILSVRTHVFHVKNVIIVIKIILHSRCCYINIFAHGDDTEVSPRVVNESGFFYLTNYLFVLVSKLL